MVTLSTRYVHTYIVTDKAGLERDRQKYILKSLSLAPFFLQTDPTPPPGFDPNITTLNWVNFELPKTQAYDR